MHRASTKGKKRKGEGRQPCSAKSDTAVVPAQKAMTNLYPDDTTGIRETRPRYRIVLVSSL